MSKDQPRLGRGLSSLISPTIHPPSQREEPPPQPRIREGENSSLAELDIEKIDTNPSQPRRVFDPERLQSLAESIKRNGTLQPVVVRRRGVDRYELVAG